MLAIIGGSGLASLTALETTARCAVRTPYGEPSDSLTFGNVGGRAVVFLARHGSGHTIPPHQINYCANIWALRDSGVRRVIAVASVGGIREDCGPGALVVPDQIIDYTWGRKSTFFEEGGAVTHVDFTEPYSPSVRSLLLAAAARSGEPVIDGGTYGATQGPRLETAAEVARLARDGCALVGMTGMPEAALAREAGLDYGALAVVVNHAAGRGDSRHRIEMDQLGRVLAQAMERARRLLDEAIAAAG
jgi:5'-deoxy-5'-methylthioadenosine phosphorylase